MSFEGRLGHTEYVRNPVVLVDTCKTCRADQTKRKVAGADSTKVKPLLDKRTRDKGMEKAVKIR